MSDALIETDSKPAPVATEQVEAIIEAAEIETPGGTEETDNDIPTEKTSTAKQLVPEDSNPHTEAAVTTSDVKTIGVEEKEELATQAAISTTEAVLAPGATPPLTETHKKPGISILQSRPLSKPV